MKRLGDLLVNKLLIKGSHKSAEVIGFSGPLGSGKTTLIKEIGRSAGINEPITSPTFTLINTYLIPNSRSLTEEVLSHVDLYRLTGGEDVELLGLDEYFDSPGVVLIEWYERAERLLPKDSVRINIEINRDSSRTVFVNDPKERL